MIERPMKLAGDELIFGQDSLSYLENIKAKKMVIVLGDDVVYKNGVMRIVENHLTNADIPYSVFIGVESDPGLDTVERGAKFMEEEKPDFILAIGGGSVMDAAKAMWIFYEHPETKGLEELMDKSKFPKLRLKAHLGCIPTTAGTASEVSRSIVITDSMTGYKCGIGNMEMMPDVAILDPITTISLPKHLTAQTGFDALTHAIEAYTSNRANYLTDILAKAAIIDIFDTLPKVYVNLNDIDLREKMLNASMVAGLSFTNASLGIVHSISHSLGSIFHVPHGILNAILLPYVIEFNRNNPITLRRYSDIAKWIGEKNLTLGIKRLIKDLEIKDDLSLYISQDDLMNKLDEVISLALEDGCTKTNPVAPKPSDIRKIILRAYRGD